MVLEQEQEQDAAQAGSTSPQQASGQATSPGSPTTPIQAPSEPEPFKDPGIFVSLDIRGCSKTTMEDYHQTQKEKWDRAKARGRKEYSPKRTDKPERTPLPSTSSSSSRSSSASSSKSKPSSAVSHLRFLHPAPAQPTPPGLLRTTRNEAYQGPPVDSKEYKKIKPLMFPSIKSRLGRKQGDSNIKSRLGHKPVRDHLTLKLTHTPQGLPDQTSPPAPAPSPSTTSPGWTGPPASSGNIQSKRIKHIPRPKQRIRRSKSNSTIVTSGCSTMSRFSAKGYNFKFKYNAKNAKDVFGIDEYIPPSWKKYDPSSPTQTDNEDETADMDTDKETPKKTVTFKDTNNIFENDKENTKSDNDNSEEVILISHRDLPTENPDKANTNDTNRDTNDNDSSEDDTPRRSPLRHMQNIIHPYKDRNHYPRNLHSNSAKYPFGEPSTDIQHTTHSKGQGEELRRVDPVQSALPRPQLTANFDPNTAGRYANTNVHFRQNVIHFKEDEFNDQLRANRHDNHGLPFCNLVNDSQQLVTKTFKKTVAAHDSMQPTTHRRKFSIPVDSTFPLPAIPGSPPSQPMEIDLTAVTTNSFQTPTSKTVTTSLASSIPQTVTVAFQSLTATTTTVASSRMSTSTTTSSTMVQNRQTKRPLPAFTYSAQPPTFRPRVPPVKPPGHPPGFDTPPPPPPPPTPRTSQTICSSPAPAHPFMPPPPPPPAPTHFSIPPPTPLRRATISTHILDHYTKDPSSAYIPHGRKCNGSITYSTKAKYPRNTNNINIHVYTAQHHIPGSKHNVELFQQADNSLDKIFEQIQSRRDDSRTCRLVIIIADFQLDFSDSVEATIEKID